MKKEKEEILEDFKMEECACGQECTCDENHDCECHGSGKCHCQDSQQKCDCQDNENEYLLLAQRLQADFELPSIQPARATVQYHTGIRNSSFRFFPILSIA